MQPDIPQVVAVMGRGVVAPDTALVTADDMGLTRGDGVFDAARVVVDADGRRVDHLDAHLARFARSCERLGLPDPDADAWRALVADALAAWDGPSGAVCKLAVTRGPEHRAGVGVQFVTITATGPAGGALDVIVLDRGYASDAFDAAPWLLGGVKVLSYAINVAAQREAARRGAHDVLFASADGYCLEGPTSGLLVAFGHDYAVTPVAGTGILASVTLEVIRDGLRAAGVRVEERLLRPDDLRAADGAWLVSAVRGVCPIATLDGRPLAQDADRTGSIAALAGF